MGSLDAVPEADQLLFSYGTLRYPQVQRETFGRLVPAEEDVLVGFRLEYADIEDAHVVGLSGVAVHPILRETGDPRDEVAGAVLPLTADEVDAADEYEVALYRRVEVTLRSGRRAWAYVARPADRVGD